MASNWWGNWDSALGGNWINRPLTFKEAYEGLPFGGDYGEDSPEALYSLWKGYQKGKGPFQDWLINQYGQIRNDYGAASLLDPTLKFGAYLQALRPELNYAKTNPIARGERQGAFTGRGRFVAW